MSAGRTAALATVVALALATGCSGSSEGAPAGHDSPTLSPAATSVPPDDVPPRLTSFYNQRLGWKDCGGGFQCARLRVPLDYSVPDDGSIRLAVVRLPADRSDERLGSLLLNPGGPGVSGITYARAADEVLTSTVRHHYDVVGFDPRGVGDSAPIHCLTDAQTDRFTSMDASPDDSAEEQAWAQESRSLGERCQARNPRLLAHVSTEDAARDMDVLRGVLGDPQLNYLGKSYGTFLGATYAELFPERVGRVVLDGVVDPADDTAADERAQATGFERALASFVDDCLPRGDCPLSGDRDAALRQVGDLLDRADSAPLSGSRPVTQSLVLLGIARAMYDPPLWPVLRRGLAEALQGRGDVLLLLADNYLDRDRNGHYTTNTNDALYAIQCLDRGETSDLDTIRERAGQLADVAPRFGAYVAWANLPCGYWPVPPVGEPGPVHATGSGPILVVGTTRDPATPYAAARHLAHELDDARLLTYDGDGHTAYRQGSACIDSAVDDYLVDGRLPRRGTRCR